MDRGGEMTEFVEVVAADAPPGVCPECRTGVRFTPMQTDFFYCGHSLRLVFRTRDKAWRIVKGIEPQYVEALVAESCLRAQLRREADEAQIVEESRGATKH
jgi:hypothetical protein